MDPTVLPPPAPGEPAASGPTIINESMLASDVDLVGSLVIDAEVISGGTDAVRSIRARGGDLVVRGILRAADLGAERQGLKLSADGTIYVSGAVDASGGGAAQAGGAIELGANQIVVTGKISSAGSEGRAGIPGAPAGAITLRTSHDLIVTGRIDAGGGNVRSDGDAVGGQAGALKVQSGGDVSLAGFVLLRGGAAISSRGAAQGGNAAQLIIDSDATVMVGGTVDARGGSATGGSSIGPTVAGGAAGELRIGEGAPPRSIALLSNLSVSGGAGDAAGGGGGTLLLEPRSGMLLINGDVDLGGGDSLAEPGAGGKLDGIAGEFYKIGDSAAGVRIAGVIDGTGGSIKVGGTGPGGSGATVTLQASSDGATLTIDPSGKVIVDGGASGGSGTAGGGGPLNLLTFNGFLSMSGTLSARGGNAPDPGGTGGLGGPVYLFTDLVHTVDGGNLLVTESGAIDASGGNGTFGGSARNNGDSIFDVAAFPDNQDQIAVLINCDGVHGNTNNWLENRGTIVARGGVHDGWGGDVAYHGIAPDRNPKPPAGHLDTRGDGMGMDGQYRSE